MINLTSMANKILFDQLETPQERFLKTLTQQYATAQMQKQNVQRILGGMVLAKMIADGKLKLPAKEQKKLIKKLQSEGINVPFKDPGALDYLKTGALSALDSFLLGALPNSWYDQLNPNLETSRQIGNLLGAIAGIAAPGAALKGLFGIGKVAEGAGLLSRLAGMYKPYVAPFTARAIVDLIAGNQEGLGQDFTAFALAPSVVGGIGGLLGRIGGSGAAVGSAVADGAGPASAATAATGGYPMLPPSGGYPMLPPPSNLIPLPPTTSAPINPLSGAAILPRIGKVVL